MSAGFVGCTEEKASPRRHEDTEKIFYRPRHWSTFMSSCPRGESFSLRMSGRKLADGLESLQRCCLVLALLALTTLPLFAVEPNEQLKDPALEARARAISTGLRCLVCQNETIDESGASLARDIRMLLREHLAAGDTDAQAVKAIVDRYGEFVLLNPPVRPATYVLWFGPVGILLVGLICGAVWVRRRSSADETAAPLTPAERSQLETILRETDR